MDYQFKEPPERHNGGKWFGHEVLVFLPREREQECWDHLSACVGAKGRDWRLSREISSTTDLYFWGVKPRARHIVRFHRRSDAVLFKLNWDEDPRPAVSDLSSSLAKFFSIPPLKTTPIINFAKVRAVGRPLRMIDDIYLLDYDASYPRTEKKPYWDATALRARGHDILTTRELEEKISGTQS